MARKPGRQTRDDDDDDLDDDEAFTPKQQDAIGKIVNAAVGGQLSRKLKSAIDGSLSGLEDRLATRFGKPGKAAETVDDDDADDDDDEPPQRQAAPKGKRGKGAAASSAGGDSALAKQIAAQNAKIATMEAERKAERDQFEARERDDKIGSALKAVGVDPNRMRGAIAVIREGVKKGEDGSYIAKVQRDGYEEEITVDKAAKEWAQTDEGRSYLADTKGQGQQRRAAGGGGVINVINGGGATKKEGANGKAAAAEAKGERKAAAMDKLAGAVNELTGGAAIDM